MSKQDSAPTVTIVIPTYKRADILPHLLAALKRQTYRNFDIVAVVKPSGDGTEQLLDAAQTDMKVKTVLQTQGHIVDAYFLGVKHSSGDIVAMLDDDAIPADDWLAETVRIFQNGAVAGVTGDSYPVLLKEGGMQIIPEDEVPSVLSHYEYALFGRPLRGLENYKNSISTSGTVYERGNNAFWRSRGEPKALLRGPSMAVKGDLLRSIDLGSGWILGCAWEMVLGWNIWKRGYSMVYCPNVKVYHIVHGRTSSRDYLNPRTDMLWAVEAELLFYRLHAVEPDFSLVSKATADLMQTIHTLKYLKTNPKYRLSKLTGMLLANVIGAKWLIYDAIKTSYSPMAELKKIKALFPR
ncbi:MAG: glycosyltransferase [Candidatus Bathyarchaeota archaeon]|nr:glycosyltransferase [Candidatus Bathyarchaeota archaeon]